MIKKHKYKRKMYKKYVWVHTNMWMWNMATHAFCEVIIYNIMCNTLRLKTPSFKNIDSNLMLNTHNKCTKIIMKRTKKNTIQQRNGSWRSKKHFLAHPRKHKQHDVWSQVYAMMWRPLWNNESECGCKMKTTKYDLITRLYECAKMWCLSINKNTMYWSVIRLWDMGNMDIWIWTGEKSI